MDGESTYESDISESWSLIDINLNEEPLLTTDTSSELKNSLSSKLKKLKLGKIDEIELKDLGRKCREINEVDSSEKINYDSGSFIKDQELETCTRAELDSVHSPCENASPEDDKNDSGDAESIEILDMDGNCLDSDIDRLGVSSIQQLDFSTYQSDDEESLEGRVKIPNRSSSSTAIKRRRRKVGKNPEVTVHSLNSKIKSPIKNALKICPSDPEAENDNFFEEDDKANRHPVYKHYRNNVANTVLSLSMGVIFAGVACIAIGHFLGVQDAAETAAELTEAIKKLQLESSALHSRLFHLNKALLNQEINPKLELPSNEPQNKVTCEGTPQLNPLKPQNADLNNAALSKVQHRLNSIEWLSKVHDMVRKNNKETETENVFDFSNFGKYIHDQLLFLNYSKEKSKVLEDVGKISKVLQKIIRGLSSYQENIENLYHETIKLKDKINQKFKKILSDLPKKSKREIKAPVTELDLQTTQWNTKNRIDENSEGEYPESIALYKFPQPEKYYKIENNLNSIKKTQFEPSKCETSNSLSFQKAETQKNYLKKKKRKNENQKKLEKKRRKIDWKKEKSKEKEFKKKKGEIRKKRTANVGKKVVEKTEKFGEKEGAKFDSRQVNYISRQGPLNETNFQSKKYSKLARKDFKSKFRLKKPKSETFKKLSKPQNYSNLKKHQLSRMCSGFQCFNLTGHWVFKWAGGREEFRRHQSLSNWQFERAKGRKEVREIDFNDNWQFERAKARKKLRIDDFNENWQFKRALAREGYRYDDRWQREEQMKYHGKEFFQEKFSWI